MSRKKKKRAGAGVNLVVNLLTVSIVFVFFGYLLGQYALNAINSRHQQAQTLPETQSVAQVVSTAPQLPASPPPKPEPPVRTEKSTVLYRVQVGVFSEKDNADRMIAMLKDAGYEGIIVSGPPYRVQTGAFSEEQNAVKLRDELINKGFEAIVVR